MGKRLQSAMGLVLAAIASASMWFYVDRILVGYQAADAKAHQRPRGNLSDLYPRWLGAREMLLHKRNPYSDELTVEIQRGYYGRALDAARPNDPKDQQGFAYPLYVIFLLAPLTGLPFHAVQLFFFWLLLGLTGLTVWFWLRLLRGRLPPSDIALGIALTLGSFPAVQGIKLQQLSLLVAALLAGSAACVAGGWLFIGGALLALATIKPQLAWPLVAWMLAWSLSDWRTRGRLALGFASMMALLVGTAEIVLPGWWRMFAEAIHRYRQYTQNRSVLDEFVPWSRAGAILGGASILTCAFLLWKLRSEPAETEGFGRAVALVMALTVLIVPMYAPYNQVLMLPAVLALALDRRLLAAGSPSLRWGYMAGTFALAWQWMGSLLLSAAYLFDSSARVIGAWKLPLFATFALPVFVFALILIDVRRVQRQDCLNGR